VKRALLPFGAVGNLIWWATGLPVLILTVWLCWWMVKVMFYLLAIPLTFGYALKRMF
jgi:hypothetical protein